MRRAFFCITLGSSLLAAMTAAPAGSQPSGKIVVLAAASLTEAFNAAAREFTQKTGIQVTFSFGGSDTLATQIKQGVPADVFASANNAQMQVVVDAGDAAGSPRTFAKNRLVLVTPRNDAVVSGLADLAKPGAKVVLAAPTVPVGGYSRSAFAKLSGHDGYPAGFASAVEKNVVSDELDVKAVLTKVVLGDADAGVVYGTDVTSGIAPKVNEYPFPAAVQPDITYPIAALKNAPNPSGARAFVDFVLSEEGQRFLKASGFISP